MWEVDMADSHAPQQNHLLSALSAAEYERLSPHLEHVQMPLGEVIYESGCQLHHVYFPTTAIVSLLYVLEDGASAEIAGVGNEGMLGVALFTGGETMPNRAVVLCAGYAYRLKTQLLKDEFNHAEGHRTGGLQNLLLRYTQALITQVSQTAVCGRHHAVEQQLCRWLLLTLDRSPLNELTVTQELIASSLGVRREGITEAAGKLQRAGFISYHRGHVTVLDRSGLKKLACECYQVVKTEFDRLLPDVVATQAVEPRCIRADLSASREEKCSSALRPSIQIRVSSNNSR
jgi:CRP-like cAMP-binding protein